MAVLHDYKCEQHGYFEAFEPVCPNGCEEGVYIVFLQAPGLISDRTKSTTKTVGQLAMDFNMSDIKSTREGDNQAGYYKRNNKTSQPEVQTQNLPQQRESRPGDSAIWGGNGFQGMNMRSMLSGGAVRPVRDESVGFSPHQAGNLTGPKPASYIADHENLKVK